MSFLRSVCPIIDLKKLILTKALSTAYKPGKQFLIVTPASSVLSKIRRRKMKRLLLKASLLVVLAGLVLLGDRTTTRGSACEVIYDCHLQCAVCFDPQTGATHQCCALVCTERCIGDPMPSPFPDEVEYALLNYAVGLLP
jgi:hypothetical protein